MADRDLEERRVIALERTADALEWRNAYDQAPRSRKPTLSEKIESKLQFAFNQLFGRGQ